MLPTTDPQTTAEPVGEALRMELAGVEELIDAGEREQARRALRRLAEGADAELAAELAEYAARLDRERDEAWIPAQPSHRWEPPRDFRSRRTAPTRRSTADRAADRKAREGDAAATAYLAERGGVDDAPAVTERAAGYELDYDLAAVPALRGTPCLNCRLERSRADRSRGDGLCGECREAGLTRESVIRARCADIAAHAGPGAAELLRRAWRRANPSDRVTIAAWVAQHPAQID